MTKKRNIPFSPPDISDLEINNVVDALKSGWITTGPKTKELERKVAEFCHTERAVCLGSATACMESILRMLGVGPGDEVITSAYTYTASASVVCHVGATLRIVDCQTDSREMDYDQLEAAITERTKVIIPVDLGGIVCDYDRIFDIVERKRHLFSPSNDMQKVYGRVIILADAAHSFGSSWHGMMSGEIADFTSFSFHAVKNFTTAEGGALTWKQVEGIDNETLYKRFMLMSLHGQSKDALAKTRLGSWEYDIIEPLYKCNMTDIMAAIGLGQMERYPGILAYRRQIIEKYYNALMPLGDLDIINHYGDDYTSNGHLFIVRFEGKDTDYRNRFIEMMSELGVACNVHFKPLPMMTAYSNLGFDIKDYPNAYRMFANAMTLPSHTKMTDEDVDYVIECFKEVIGKC